MQKLNGEGEALSSHNVLFIEYNQHPGGGGGVSSATEKTTKFACGLSVPTVLKTSIHMLDDGRLDG